MKKIRVLVADDENNLRDLIVRELSRRGLETEGVGDGEAALARLREARAGTDRDLIHERTTEVNRATERLAEAMMDAALKGALTSKRADRILESP